MIVLRTLVNYIINKRIVGHIILLIKLFQHKKDLYSSAKMAYIKIKMMFEHI